VTSDHKVPHFRSGRLSKAISPAMQVSYPPPDERVSYLLEAIHSFDKAHTITLLRAGEIDLQTAAALLRGLREIDRDIVAIRLDQGGHIHSGEEYLTARLGEHVAGQLHTGRSSGDLYAVATRMTQGARYQVLATAQCELIDVCLELAQREADTVMPSYTHLQQAQCTTFGHYLVGWVEEALRGVERVRQAAERNDASPAGAAVGTGSPFALDPRLTADLLGFRHVFVNSREAIWSVDLVLEGLWAGVSVAGSWARMADDLQIWSTSEFGMIDVDEAFSINSSIMPQKKNPIALQHVRGVLGTALGHLTAGVTICRAPSDTLVVDRELAIEGLWHALDDVTGGLQLMAALLRSITVNRGRMRAVLSPSWAYSSDLASLLVLVERLSWREAQQVVSTLVRKAIGAGIGADQVTFADLQNAALRYLGHELSTFAESDMADARDPDRSLLRRVVPGGPAPDDVRHQVKLARTRLAAERALLAERETSQRTAARLLTQTVEDVIAEATASAAQS